MLATLDAVADAAEQEAGTVGHRIERGEHRALALGEEAPVRIDHEVAAIAGESPWFHDG